MIGQSNTQSGNGIWNTFTVRTKCNVADMIQTKTITIEETITATEGVQTLSKLIATQIRTPGVYLLTAVSTSVNTPVDIEPYNTDWDGSSVAITVPPASGGTAIAPDGVITYTPALDFVGVIIYTYTIIDTSGEVDCLRTVVQYVQVQQAETIAFLGNYVLYITTPSLGMVPSIPGFVYATPYVPPPPGEQNLVVGLTMDVFSTNHTSGTFPLDTSTAEITGVVINNGPYPDPDITVNFVAGDLFVQCALPYFTAYLESYANAGEISYRVKDTDGNYTNTATLTLSGGV